MDIEEAKEKIIQNMKVHGIDVDDVSCSIQEKEGRQWVVPERRKLHSGVWLPILNWSFVSFDPTRWGFAVELSLS